MSLDLPSEAEQAEKDPGAFLSRHPCPLIIDEVQHAPALFRNLKSSIDGARDKNGQFVLTGSQRLSLMESVSESLAGRTALVELEGLGFWELRAARPAADPVSFAWRGALPELWAKSDLGAPAYYHAYVATYLERDVRSLLNVSSLRDFERFLRACALRSGQILNKAELARDVGISPSTAGQWLSVLEASDQISLLEPWFSNRTKSLVKSPKLYLNDTGLACFLLGITSLDDLFASPLTGAIWETVVCAELRRKLRSGVRSGQLFYWRDRTKEADFLIHRGGRFDLYDAKWSERPSSGDASSLVRVAAELPAGAVLQQAIVCRTLNRHPLSGQVEAIPLAEL